MRSSGTTAKPLLERRYRDEFNWAGSTGLGVFVFDFSNFKFQIFFFFFFYFGIFIISRVGRSGKGSLISFFVSFFPFLFDSTELAGWDAYCYVLLLQGIVMVLIPVVMLGIVHVCFEL
jgi:hypothetical protein